MLVAHVTDTCHTRRRSRWMGFFLTALRSVFLVQANRNSETPLLRGKTHLLLLYLSPAWIWGLLVCCASKLSFFSVFLCATCSLFNFGASALLHNFPWSDRRSEFLTKLDYAGIFVMISGSCCPIPLLMLRSTAGMVYLVVQWASAAIGVGMTVFGNYIRKEKGPRATIYVLMGLSNCLFIREVMGCLTKTEFSFLVAMAVLYITGAVFYARKAPNVWPGILGYHELFHLCCFGAGVCTWILNRSVLLRFAMQSRFEGDVMDVYES